MTFRLLNANSLSNQQGQAFNSQGKSNVIRLSSKLTENCFKNTLNQKIKQSASSLNTCDSNLTQNNAYVERSAGNQEMVNSASERKIKSKQVVEDLLKIKRQLEGIRIYSQVQSQNQNNTQNNSYRNQTIIGKSNEPTIRQSIQISKINPQAISQNNSKKIDMKIVQKQFENKRLNTEPSYSQKRESPVLSTRYSINNAYTDRKQQSSNKNYEVKQFNKDVSSECGRPTYNKNSNYGYFQGINWQKPSRQTTPIKINSGYDNVYRRPLIQNNIEKQYSLNSANSDWWQKQKQDLNHRIMKLENQKQHIMQQNINFKAQLDNQCYKNRSLTQKNAKIQAEYFECQKREQQSLLKVMKLQRQLFSVKNQGKNHYNFNDILKGQIEETQKIKQIIQQKNDEISRLNDQIAINRRNLQQTVNCANLQQLKFMSQKRQMAQMEQIKLLNKQNELKRYKHMMETLESKLQVAIQQNKTKDQFIQQHLVGRAKSIQQKQYVQQALQKYQVQFEDKKLISKLQQQLKEIQRLRKIVQSQQHF